MKERFRRIGAVILALCLLLTTLNLGVLAEDGDPSIANSHRAPADNPDLPGTEDAALPSGDGAASPDTAIGNPSLPGAEDAAVEADAPDAAPLSGADDALDSAPQIEYSASGYSGAYDGAAHAITVNVATAGCSVRYAYPVGSAYGTNNPTFTVPGTYTVGYLITAPSYPDVEGSATVTITEGTIDYSVDGFVVEYDGRPHFIQLDVATEGISVRYAVDDGAYSAVNPGITDVGQYVVYYILEKQYYASEEGSVTVEITKIDISDEIRAGLPASFTYSGDPVHFDLPYDKIKEWSVIYWNGDGGTWDAPSAPGSYIVEISGEGEMYCANVRHSFSIVETLPQIEYTAGGYNDMYDGAAHSIDLSVTTPGVSVSYATSKDGAYSATLPSFTDAGEYTVWFRLEKANYATVIGSAEVKIIPAQIQFTTTGYEVVYDGAPHTIRLEIATEGTTVTYATSGDGAYSATLPTFTDTGAYTVWFRIEKKNYSSVLSSAMFAITPLEIQYSAGDYDDYYDGKPHSISLNLTTGGVRTTYATSEDGTYTETLPGFTAPGAYTVWFKLEKKNYETVTDFATVTIRELAQIDYGVQGYTGVYDGKPHSIALNVATEGGTVTYASSENGTYTATLPTFITPGAYTVWFKLEKAGYETVVDSATVTIRELSQIDYSVQGYNDYYDGKAHTISLSVTTPGVSATYASSENGAYSADKPSFTEPGAYTVWFKLEKAGYATVIDSATVTIMELSQIAYDVQGYSGYYDGEAHTISLHVSTPDATVTYATSEGGEYSAAKPSFSGVGTHTIWYRIEKEHYETVEGSEVVKLRQPKEDSIVYSVEDYVGAYDGEAHTIALDVTTPDVRASYATSEKGAYGATLPTFTEPGMYTVWFRLEKSGFETSTGSATVTIEKAEQILYFEQRPILVNPSQVYIFYVLPGLGLKHDQGDGALSWSSSDPSRIFVENDDIINGKVTFSAFYEEWSKGYSPTITVTAAETDHYKAATATCTVMASSSVNYYYLFYTGNDSQNQEMLLSTNLDLTILPVTEQDGNLLSSVSNALRKKLMASAGSSQIGAMAVNAVLTDTQTGEELHSTNGDLTLSFTGSLGQSYQMNYKNMACVAVHIKQNSTNAVPTDEGYDFTMPTGDVTVNSSFAHMPHSTPAPQDTTSDGAGASAGSSGFTMSGGTIDTSGANSDGSGVYAGSLSPTVEFIPCKLTKSGVVIKDTSLSPFLLIYGPKEAFSKLLTVRAKDGVFTYDGEGHAVAAEPSIAEGTTLYYSLDLESWQTDAPAFTDVLWNEDGSVGSYQVYVLADNPDCDPAVCSYSVTILPAQ